MRQVYELFLKKSFDSVEKKDKAYCFMAYEDQKTPVRESACRKWDTLLKQIDAGEVKFWTPNTFYENQRLRKNLRWLNCFFADIDAKDNPGLTFPDLLDRITVAGLPVPTLIIQTPSGGFHVYWAIEPVRATFKTIRLYEVLSQIISQQIGADLIAIGAERYMRIPYEKNILMCSENIYSFDDFKDWRELNELDTHRSGQAAGLKILAKGILQHPAFQKLLKGVSKGIRDNTCFTLALALRLEGYTEEQAFPILHEWDKLNDPGDDLPLSVSTIREKIKSAYSGKYFGPSSYWVTLLSGIEFSYKVFSVAKPRQERKRSHISEWAEDILDFLADNQGIWCGSQKELAKLLSAPLRSIKEALKWLVQDVKISLRVEGSGRGAKTVINQITVSDTVKVFPKATNQAQKLNFPKIAKKAFGEKIVHTDIHPNGLAPPLRGSPG